MVPRPKGEESEAWNRAAFDSLGQKRRVIETPSLIQNDTLHHGIKDAVLQQKHIEKARPKN
jgi:hypothetical protein